MSIKAIRTVGWILRSCSANGLCQLPHLRTETAVMTVHYHARTLSVDDIASEEVVCTPPCHPYPGSSVLLPCLRQDSAP